MIGDVGYLCYSRGAVLGIIPSGYVKIAIENGD
jgi:hypothetical protein